MGSSCAVQGVVRIKPEYINIVKSLYMSLEQELVHDIEDKRILSYLFGVNISNYIQTHFSNNAENYSFNKVDFVNGYLTFISGFSSYDLGKFIEKVKTISDHYILYANYESSSQLHNERVVVKNLANLSNYMVFFDGRYYAESDIPFEEFNMDGEYVYVQNRDNHTNYPFWEDQIESCWEYYEL